MMQVAVPTLVIVMMVSVGLELSVAEVFRRPRLGRWLTLGLFVNLVAFPLWTWVLIRAVDQGAGSGFAAGLILCAASPGGPVGPVIARLAKADLGFAAALMILLGVVGLLTTPLTVSLFLGGDQSRLLVPMFSALLLFQILPLAVAMTVRRTWPQVAARLAGPAAKLANLLLLVVVVGLLATRWDAIFSIPLRDHATLAAGLLVVLAGVCHWSSGGSLLRGLLVVTAIRNMSVALLLATRLFTDPQTEVGILVWAFWMIVIAPVVGLVATRFATETNAADPTWEPIGTMTPAPH